MLECCLSRKCGPIEAAGSVRETSTNRIGVRTMSLCRWSDITTMKFVHLYQGEECLWNARLLDYKNKDARYRALERIAAAMDLEGFGVTDVKYKIKNIRSSYCQELKKIHFSQASCSSPEDVYKPNVVWFNTLDSFLKSFVFQRDKTNCQLDRFGRRNAPAIKDEEVVMEDVTQLYDTDEVWTEVEEDASEKQDAVEMQLQEVSTAESARHNFKRFRPQDSDLVGNAVDRLKTMLDKKADDGEFEAFGRSVACQLKRLSGRRAASAQMKIQTILSEERIDQEME